MREGFSANKGGTAYFTPFAFCKECKGRCVILRITQRRDATDVQRKMQAKLAYIGAQRAKTLFDLSFTPKQKYKEEKLWQRNSQKLMTPKG